jgi:hypothetical protein
MKALGYDYEYDDDAPTLRFVRPAPRVMPDVDTLTQWTGSTSTGPMLLSLDPPGERVRSPSSRGHRLRYLWVLLLVANAGVLGGLYRYRHRHRETRVAPSSDASRRPRECVSTPRPLITTSAIQKTLNSTIQY